jgi:predicted GTPase
VLDRDGIPRAIILDTAGYDEADPSASPFAAFKDQVLNSDLVLVVVSARSASRAADRRLLDELRALFQRQPDRLMPPVVVALSNVDQLRPIAEWSPPYDLAHPERPKARQIVEAIEAVEQDLALGPDQVVVPVCLKPDRVYNVEDGLAPAILNAASEAQRVKYLRCLRQFREADAWPRVWRQALNSGRVLLRAGAAWAGRKLGG